MGGSGKCMKVADMHIIMGEYIREWGLVLQTSGCEWRNNIMEGPVNNNKQKSYFNVLPHLSPKGERPTHTGGGPEGKRP